MNKDLRKVRELVIALKGFVVVAGLIVGFTLGTICYMCIYNICVAEDTESEITITSVVDGTVKLLTKKHEIPTRKVSNNIIEEVVTPEVKPERHVDIEVEQLAEEVENTDNIENELRLE